ncbi:MAG TPA: hypothetical protein PLS11_15710, partial [Ottowia sp.]|uniref:hypothetical protein n=1 Tax=Ottowia sp. TaxID=1898956 RepID=UPI002B5BABDE
VVVQQSRRFAAYDRLLRISAHIARADVQAAVKPKIYFFPAVAQMPPAGPDQLETSEDHPPRPSKPMATRT